MPQPERFDSVVLGCGKGGRFLAVQLSRQGRRVAMVERQYIGGSCRNVNCLPSKNEIWSAKVAHLARHAAQFGTRTGPVEVDMPRVLARKRAMVERLIAETLELLAANHVELILGNARLLAPRTLEVRLNEGGTRVLEGDQLFLNLGTRPAIPSIPGMEAAAPMTNIEELELSYVPRHLVILGGGYVGLESAQAFRRFGSRVTVVQHGRQLMKGEDPDVAEEVQRLLEAEGVEVLLSAETQRVQGRSGDQVRLSVRTPSGEKTIEATDLLAATGRTPNTGGVGLEEAGVELDPRGYIRVNDRLETTAPNVWAIGESAGSPQFTHVSLDDFRIIRDNLAGGHRSTNDRLIPFCVFIDPPLARVGMSEAEARRKGIQPRVAKIAASELTRTRTLDEEKGFLKALVAPGDDQILGFTMIGAEAGEVVTAVQMAMLAGFPYQRVRDAVINHPTMGEGLGLLLSNVPAR